MASSTIGQLRVILGMDSAEFEKGTQKASKSLTRFEKNMGSVRKGMGGLAKAAGVLGVAIGAAFSLNSIKRGLDYAASLGEISQAMGVTVEQLQIYRFAATQVNITQEEMDKGLGKLTKSIGEAALGAQQQSRVFKGLGISIKDTEGNVRATGDIMLDLADAIAKIRSPAEQAAVATQLFGRAGQKLLPLLREGSEGIRRYAAEAEKLGIVISSELADKADKASDRMALLNQQLSVKFAKVVSENADAILGMANALAFLTEKIAQWWRQHPERIAAVLGALAGARFGPFGAGAGAAAGFEIGKELKRQMDDEDTDLNLRLKRLREATAAFQKARKDAGTIFSDPFGLVTVREGPGLKEAQAELERQTQLAIDAAKAFDAAKLRPKIEGGIFGEGGLELDEFLGGSKAGGRKGGKSPLQRAEEQLRKGLASMRETLQQGFDDINLPAATSKAEELRRELDELAASARESGVGVGKFSGEIAVLKARISELEAAGLEEEAKDFTKAVERQAKSVSSFARGGLPELEEALSQVDDRYDTLRQSIEDQIEENAVLAGSNATAARAMQLLQDQLGKLEEAHKRATDAAIAQHRAESAIADLQVQRQAGDIQADIQQLRQDRGDFGPVSESQRELIALEHDLSRIRIDAAITLRQMEAERDAAERQGDLDQVTRLNQIIGLQRTYFDEVTQTNASQVLAAQRAQDAWDDFTNNLTDALDRMITNFDFSLDSLRDVFQSLISDLLRPQLEEISRAISDLLRNVFKSLFAGGFASGGVIPHGKFGIVGENGPELAFAGRHDLSILPGGSHTFNINLTTPNSGDPRRDRQAAMQAASILRAEIAKSARQGF